MSLVISRGIKYFQFSRLASEPLTHAIFSRHGGVSVNQYAKLNVGATVGDDRANVEENLRRAFAAVGRPRHSLFDSWLVHGTNTLVAEAPRPLEWERPPQADIVMTDKPDVTLFMRFADCVPLVLYDPSNRAIALAHAGWRGTLLGLATSAVEAMKANYSSKPADLLVGIGPAISMDRYEVGPDVAAEVQKIFGSPSELLLTKSNGKFNFDLVGANKTLLEKAGVRNVELANICTATNSDDWFSHRASGGKTGRFGALIALS
jgi:YfiH family protein